MKLSLTVVINSRENPGLSLWHLNWSITFICNFSGWIHLPHQVLVNINYISVVSCKGLLLWEGGTFPNLFYCISLQRAAESSWIPTNGNLFGPKRGTSVWQFDEKKRIKNAFFTSLEGSQEWDYQSWEQLLFVRVCVQCLLQEKPSYPSLVPCSLCFFLLTLLIWCTFV